MKTTLASLVAFIFVFSPFGFLMFNQNVFAVGPNNPPGNTPIYTGPGGSPYVLPDITTTATRDGGSCPATFTTYPKDLKEVVCFFLGFINKLLPILLAMTLLVFFWGLVGLIRSSGDEKAVSEGKQFMLWGIVGLFVLVSFAGIISLFTGDFFGQSFGIPQLPQ